MPGTVTYNMTIYLLVLYICQGTVTYNMNIYLLVLYICPGTVTYNMNIYLLLLYICPTIYLHKAENARHCHIEYDHLFAGTIYMSRHCHI